MAKSIVIGVDLGGTRLRAARLDENLQVLGRDEVLTQADEGAEATIERMKNLIAHMLPQDNTPVLGIGVSAPGPANPKTGVVVAPPNLPGWHNVPLVDILRARFGLPVYLGNDANVAALAEVVRGAARGARNAIFITVSTGIGSGMIIDGKMLLGRDGLAAEAGHIVMIVDGRVSSLEKEAAGPALARQLRARIAAGESSAAVAMVNGDLNEIDGSIVGRAAEAGDAAALAVVTRAGQILGLGMVSLLHLFNPEILVFGGGVSNLGDLLFRPMRDTIQTHALDPMYWRDLRIERAALGDNVSLVGAGALVITEGGVGDVRNVLQELEDAP
ncbi:MAG: ROK family protein [bacterium]|nr:ROK family protein [bacterium]